MYNTQIKVSLNAQFTKGTTTYEIGNTGAKYTTSGTANHQIQIQQALNDASAAGGGVVVLSRPQIYYVDQNIILKSNVSLQAVPGARLRVAAGKKLLADTCIDFEILNLWFDGSLQGVNDFSLELGECERFNVEKNMFIGGLGLRLFNSREGIVDKNITREGAYITSQGTNNTVFIGNFGKNSAYSIRDLTNSPTNHFYNNRAISVTNPIINTSTLNNKIGNTSNNVSVLDQFANTVSFSQNAIFNGTTAGINSTNISEGSNLFFTFARALAATLGGLNATLTGPISAADNVLTAFGRTQAQLGGKMDKTGGTFTGDVGLGGVIPLDALHLLVGNVKGIRIQSNDTCAVLDFYSTGRTFSWRTNFNTPGFELTRSATAGGSATASVLHFNDAGDLHIGGINATEKLQVTGNIALSGNIIKAANPAMLLVASGQVNLASNFIATAGAGEEEVTGLRVTLPILAGITTSKIKITYIIYTDSAVGDNNYRIRVGSSLTYTSNTQRDEKYISGVKTVESLSGVTEVNGLSLTSQRYINLSVVNPVNRAGMTLSASGSRSSIYYEIYA